MCEARGDAELSRVSAVPPACHRVPSRPLSALIEDRGGQGGQRAGGGVPSGGGVPGVAGDNAGAEVGGAHNEAGRSVTGAGAGNGGSLTGDAGASGNTNGGDGAGAAGGAMPSGRGGGAGVQRRHGHCWGRQWPGAAFPGSEFRWLRLSRGGREAGLASVLARADTHRVAGDAQSVPGREASALIERARAESLEI